MNSPLALFQIFKEDNVIIWFGPVKTWFECPGEIARQKEAVSEIYARLINFLYRKLIFF